MKYLLGLLVSVICLLGHLAHAEPCEALGSPDMASLWYCPESTPIDKVVAIVKENSEKILKDNKIALVQVWNNKDKTPRTADDIFAVKSTDVDKYQTAYYVFNKEKDHLIFFCRKNDALVDCSQDLKPSDQSSALLKVKAGFYPAPF